jgi:hypothetical protein
MWDCPGCGTGAIAASLEKCPGCGAKRPKESVAEPSAKAGAFPSADDDSAPPLPKRTPKEKK